MVSVCEALADTALKRKPQFEGSFVVPETEVLDSWPQLNLDYEIVFKHMFRVSMLCWDSSSIWSMLKLQKFMGS